MSAVGCDLHESFTEFSMAFSGNADQINGSTSLNSRTVFLALVPACDKTPLQHCPKPDNPVD